MLSFPKHMSLCLSHNPHKDYYMSVEDYQKDYSLDFIDGEFIRAKKSDDFWVLQWYPDTPIGFHILAASTLEILLRKGALL